MKRSFRNALGFFVRYGLVCLAILPIVAGCGTDKKIKYTNGALPPDEAIASFELEPGFKIELIAAEPLVADPVDMEIDEYGRMYVVEMHGYPLDKSGNGKIKLLTDTDGDGRMDKSTVFADNLVLPNGILRWKQGILVTDAPNVLYFEDTDGDGIADRRDTVLTGFSLSNPHINVNNPIYGLDNFIHLAHRGAITTRSYQDIFGDEGEEIRFPGKQGSPVLPKNAESRSVRFRPDRQQIEMTSGRAQFGHTFDEWGRHLFADNQNHAFAESIALPYLKRNPELLITEATTGISDHGDAAEIFQITEHPERQMFSGAGVMTSASGVVAYLGGAFPPPFDKKVTFVCESVSNLVHADKLRDTGTTFIASRIGRAGKEFLASTDAWSRPVNLYIGPDGALYMVDYYRQIIEHPEWMSDEAIAAGGLYNGIDMGRIYRISATDAPPADWTKGIALGDADSHTLVEKLSSNNIWWRTHAQRLLVDRQDSTVTGQLINMAVTNPVPEARVHALWTLEGLGYLTPDLIGSALRDTVAGVRENAIKLSESYILSAPVLADALLSLQNDPDPKVRYQLLCTLGYLNSKKSEQARQHLLFRDIDDKWVQVAALSAASAQSGSLLPMVLDRFQPGVPAYNTLVEHLTAMTGSSGSIKDITSLIRKSASAATGSRSAWQAPVLKGLSQGMRTRKLEANLDNEQKLLVSAVFTHPSAAVRNAAIQLLKVIGIDNETQAKAGMTKAAGIAGNRSLPDERRVEAIDFIALRDPEPHKTLLQQLIVPQEHPSVQIAAVKTLGLLKDETVTRYALQQWEELTPAIREVALNTFMANPVRRKQLLDALETGTVLPSNIGWGRSAQLMQDNDDNIRNRARVLLAPKDEQDINKEYQQTLTLKGNLDSGRLVFQQNCALCHQVRGEMGVAFGPDLGTVQGWLAKDILANILSPNQSIAVGFDLWEVELKTGERMQGIISGETSSALTIKSAPGVEKTLNRQEIQNLRVMNTSLMPPLNGQINPQEMADLIAFLRQTN